MSVADQDSDARGEPRAPVVLALLVTMSLPFLMPERFLPGPKWLIPAMEGGLLAVMLAMDPGRIDKSSHKVRAVRIALTATLVTVAALSTERLVRELLDGTIKHETAETLLRLGAGVWLGLVIAFAFLYWELDGGGPGARAHGTHRFPDLAFVQQLNPELAPEGWRPVFADYLYLGFTNTVAFSPTDVMPLAHWAKLAMGVQAFASLLIFALVFANAVNILS